MQDLDGYPATGSEVPVTVVNQARKDLEWIEVSRAKYGMMAYLPSYRSFILTVTGQTTFNIYI